MKCLVKLTALISVLGLSGCMTPGKNALPQGGDMTMSQIYQQQTGSSMDSSNGSDLKRVRNMVHAKYTRRHRVDSSHTAGFSNVQFKQLPNPKIGMYVFPHLVFEDGEAQPVPGYETAFFLYKENHFAMPSEEY
jgi:conjugative transfer region lipoprotein (TIGR03751 family)